MNAVLTVLFVAFIVLFVIGGAASALDTRERYERATKLYEGEGEEGEPL